MQGVTHYMVIFSEEKECEAKKRIFSDTYQTAEWG